LLALIVITFPEAADEIRSLVRQYIPEVVMVYGIWLWLIGVHRVISACTIETENTIKNKLVKTRCSACFFRFMSILLN